MLFFCFSLPSGNPVCTSCLNLFESLLLSCLIIWNTIASFTKIYLEKYGNGKRETETGRQRNKCSWEHMDFCRGSGLRKHVSRMATKPHLFFLQQLARNPYLQTQLGRSSLMLLSAVQPLSSPDPLLNSDYLDAFRRTITRLLNILLGKALLGSGS